MTLHLPTYDEFLDEGRCAYCGDRTYTNYAGLCVTCADLRTVICDLRPSQGRRLRDDKERGQSCDACHNTGVLHGEAR